MKIVLLSLAALAFVATGSLTMTSCGSDDSTTAPVDDTPGDGEVPVGKDIELALVTAPEEIYEGRPFQLSIKTVDGENVDGAQLYAFGEPITNAISVDGMFTINGPAGPVELYAMYEDVESNTVTVEVLSIPVAEPEGTGEFQFGGDAYTVEASYVGFMGLTYEDETKTTVVAKWQTEAYSNDDTIAIVVFTTPTTPGPQQGTYNYELPTATNITARLAAVQVGSGQSAQSFQTTDDVELEFNAVPNTFGNAFEGDYSATSADIEGEAFSIDFDGVMPYFDGSQKAAKGAKAFKASNVAKVDNSLSITKTVRLVK